MWKRCALLSKTARVLSLASNFKIVFLYMIFKTNKQNLTTNSSFIFRSLQSLNQHYRVLRLKREGWYKKGFPASIDFSLSVYCQARCIFCPVNRGFGVKPPFMPFDLAKKIIDDAYRENFTGIFRFSENGESLLNKSFLRIFEYCRQKFSKNELILFTNMALLDKDSSSKLLKLGLNKLNLNIDGASKETYEATKRNLNFEKLRKNLHDFFKIRESLGSSCRVSIHILTYHRYIQEINKYLPESERQELLFNDDTEQVIKYWKPLLRNGDTISIIQNPYKWAIQEKLQIPKKLPCAQLHRNMRHCFIGPNGNAYLCCLDYKQQLIYGNLYQSSIRDVWNGLERKRMLKLLDENRFNELGEPCRYCLSGPDLMPLSRLLYKLMIQMREYYFSSKFFFWKEK